MSNENPSNTEYVTLYITLWGRNIRSFKLTERTFITTIPLGTSYEQWVKKNPVFDGYQLSDFNTAYTYQKLNPNSEVLSIVYLANDFTFARQHDKMKLEFRLRQ